MAEEGPPSQRAPNRHALRFVAPAATSPVRRVTAAFGGFQHPFAVLEVFKVSRAKDDVHIRRAAEKDIPRLLPLARDLADVEHQLDTWAVTAALTRDWTYLALPDVGCFVVETPDSTIVGLASYHVCRFAGGIKPTLFVNGLFVLAALRRQGIGRRLIGALAREARDRGCGPMAWQIGKGDAIAARFSESHGARPDPNGIDYRMPREAVEQCAMAPPDRERMPISSSIHNRGRSIGQVSQDHE